MRYILVSGIMVCAAVASTVEIGTMQTAVTTPFSC